MQIETAREPGHVKLRLRGRLDSQTAERVGAELQEHVRSGDHRLELDLAEVDFLSSAGIRVLVRGYQSTRKLGGWFAITACSEAVSSVLRLTGLQELMSPPPATAPRPPEAVPSPAAAPATQPRTAGTLRYETWPLAPDARLRCSAHGDPDRLVGSEYGPADAARVQAEPDTFAVGIGALGSSFADCSPRFGEYMAAGSAVLYRPADDAAVPDYMLASGELVPAALLLYGLVCSGPFSHFIRFEPAHPAEPVTLTDVLELALATSGGDTVGMVMAAGISGLIGVSLRRPPVTPVADSRFAFPAARQWFALTPERVYEHHLGLVCGVVTRQADSGLKPHVRPWDRAGRLFGHLHAGVFTYRGLPQGPLDLAQTVSGLCTEERLVDVMHLMNDWREITGMGESLLTYGALWLAPVAEVRGAP